MPLLLPDFSKIGTLASFWKLMILSATGVLVKSVIDHAAATRTLSCFDFGSTSACAFTLAAFGMGDSALLSTSGGLQRTFRRGPMSMLVSRFVVLEYAFVILHAVMLNLLAWFACRNVHLFIGAAVVLSALNLVWLSISLTNYFRFNEKLGDRRHRLLHRDLQICILAIPTWIQLNAVFLAICGLLMVAENLLLLPASILERLIPWLAAIRSGVDLVACNHFYADVLCGKFGERFKNSE